MNDSIVELDQSQKGYSVYKHHNPCFLHLDDVSVISKKPDDVKKITSICANHSNMHPITSLNQKIMMN